MSKISCDIIQDMLPLYYDEVCSADSRKMIEEHLQECEKCSNIFQKLKTECVVDTKENAESIQSSVMGKMATFTIKVIYHRNCNNDYRPYSDIWNILCLVYKTK